MDVVMEDFDDDPSQMLRPVFDAVWQSVGWEHSHNYDDEGTWVGR